MPELDEFGIPIKKKIQQQVDEFGIEIKKKSGGISGDIGGTGGSSKAQSNVSIEPPNPKDNPFAIGQQFNQPPKLEAEKLDLSNTQKNAAIAEQIKTPLRRIPETPILDQTKIQKPISEIDAREGIARQKQHKIDMETAIDNTTLKVLKQKGIVAGKGSPYYEAERKKIEAKTKPTMIGGIVINGAEATYHKDKDGNIGLDRNLGFFEGIRKGFNAAVDGEDEANAFAEMDTKQKVEYANKQMEGKPTEYMEERGGVGELLGGATPYLVKAAAAGTLATASSLVGAAPVLTVLLTAPDMIKQGAKDEIMTRYHQLKQENPLSNDEDLMRIAEQGGISGGIVGAAEALAFTTTLKLPILKDSKDVLTTYLKGVASSAVHLGGIMAGTTAAKIAERKLEGYNVKTDEAIDEITTAFTENAKAGAILNGVISGAHTLPKVIKSAFKYALKDTPISEIKTALQANVEAGRIPPEVAEKTVADIEGYKVALAKTADGLKPETQASVAGLIQARDNVAAEMATKDPTQRAVYEQKIEAYNKQIEKITETNDPLKYEIDEVTGNPIDKIAPISTETKRADVPPPTEQQSGDVSKDSGLRSVDEVEVQRQMQPITDKMAEIEREFENKGYEIDWDYDNEIQVTDKKGNLLDAEDVPTELHKSAAEYEKATRQLGEFSQSDFVKSLDNSRKRAKGEEIPFEEVGKKQLPQQSGKDGVVEEGRSALRDVDNIELGNGNKLVKNNDRSVKAGKNFVFDENNYDVQDKNGNNLGSVHIADKGEYYQITNVQLKNERTGLGSEIYKTIISKLDKPLISDKALSEKAKGLWDKLVKEGVAEKFNDTFELGGKTYTEDRYRTIKPKKQSLSTPKAEPLTSNVVEGSGGVVDVVELANKEGFKVKFYDGKGKEGGIHSGSGDEISINKNVAKGNTTFYLKGVEADTGGSHTIELPTDKSILFHEIGHKMFSNKSEIGHQILNKLKEYRKSEDFGHPTGYSAIGDLFDATMMDFFAFYKLAPKELKSSQPKVFELMKEWEDAYKSSNGKSEKGVRIEVIDFENESETINTEQAAKDAEKIAKNNNVNILRGKDLKSVAVDKEGKTVGGLWTEVNGDEFSFDVAIDKISQGQGVGEKLVKDAISQFNNEKEANPNLKYKVDVTNPIMEKLLSKYGFKVSERVGDHTIMEHPTNKPKAVEQSLKETTKAETKPIKNEEAQDTKDTNTPTVESKEQPLVIEPTPKTEAAKGKEPPPSEPAEPVGEEGGKNGITHAANEVRRKDRLLPEYEKEPQTFEAWNNEAEQKIKDGYDVEKLMNEIEKGKDPTPVENAIRKIYIATLDAEIAKNPTDALLSKQKRFIEIGDLANSRAGRNLVSLKGENSPLSSISDFYVAKMDALGAETLTEAQKAEVKKQYEYVQETQSDAAAKIKLLEEENAKLRAEAEVKSTKSTTKKQKKDFTKEREDLKQSIKEKWRNAGKDTLSSDIPYRQQLFAIAPDVAKLMKSYVEEGVTEFGEIIKRLHDAIKEVEPRVTEKDVADILSGQYDVKKETKVDLLQKLKQIKNRKSEEAIKIIARIKSGDFSAPKKEVSWVENPELKKKFPKEYNAALDAIKTKEDARHEFDIALLRDQMARRTVSEKATGALSKTAGTIKAITTGIDDSAVAIQTYVSMLVRPRTGVKAFYQHIRQGVSQKKFDRWLSALHSSPDFKEMREMGLDVTEPASLKEREKEEIFNNRFNGTVKIKGKEYKLLDAPLKPFERAFTTLGNVTRVVGYRTISAKYKRQGYTPEKNPELFKSLAKRLNTETGRGEVNEYVDLANKVVTMGIWSPKLMAQKFNILGISDVASLFLSNAGTKGYYRQLHPKERLAAITDVAQFATTVMALSYGFALAFGGDVDDDPLSSTFMDVKLDNGKSYNFTGGFSGYIRAISQFAAGKKHKDGELIKTGRLETASRFFRGKTPPLTSAVLNLAGGKNFMGQPTTPLGELQNLAPISVRGIVNQIQNDGASSFFTQGIPTFFGLNVKNEKDYQKPSELTPEELKDPTLKLFNDKGVNFPEMNPEKIQTKEVNNKVKEKLSYYDQATQDLFIKKKKEYLKIELIKLKNGHIKVYVNKDGNATAPTDAKDKVGKTYKPFDQLTKEQIQNVISSSISGNVTEKVKKEVLKGKTPVKKETP